MKISISLAAVILACLPLAANAQQGLVAQQQIISQNARDLHDRVRAELLPVAVVGRMTNDEYKIHSALYTARENDRRFGTKGSMTVAKWEAEQCRFIAIELNKIGVRSRLINNFGGSVQVRQLTTEVLAQAENVVRIQRGESFGSGTYLGDGLILTCAHLWDRDKSATVRVLFIDGRTINGKPLKIDIPWDQAIVQLTHNHPTAIGSRLAAANPVVGQGVTVAGYDGGARRIRWRMGSVVRTWLAMNKTSPGDWYEMSREVAGGASGGPVFDDQGKLIGNLWGAGNYRTTSLTAGRTRLFLTPWFPRLSAWGDRIRQGGPNCIGPDCNVGQQPGLEPEPGGIDVFETPVAPTPIAPIAPLAPIIAEKIDYKKLLDMMAKDSRFRGEKGDKGEKGETAQLDVMALAEAIKATLPPIYFNVIGSNGEVISSEAIPLGGSFDLELSPVK